MPTPLPVNFHVQVTLQAFSDMGMKNPMPMPPGAMAVWSGSDDSVATVKPDPSDPSGLTGLVTAVSASIGATMQPACVVTIPGPSTPFNVVIDSVVLTSDQLAAIAGVFGTPVHN